MFFLGALSSLFIALVGNCTDRVYDLLTERENKFSVTLFVKAGTGLWGSGAFLWQSAVENKHSLVKNLQARNNETTD